MTDDLVERLREPCFERGLDELWIDAEREEAADRIETLQAEVERLRGGLERIGTPAAFYVAMSDVDPEAYARMIYADKVRDGMALDQANAETEAETRGRYPLRRAALEGKDG